MTLNLNNLNAWFDYCCKTPLPVTSRSVAMVQAAIKEGKSSFQQLSFLVASDPALCFHVLQHANQHNQNPDTEIRTLDHAMSLLGMNRLEALLESLPKVDIDLKQLAHRRYLQCLATSLHAAYQAKAWTRLRKQDNNEGIYWGSLFYQSIYWQLWLCAKDHMRKREVLIKQRGLSIVAAETQIFGMPLEQLALKLAQHWRLPIATQKALSPQFHPSKRQLVVLSKENSLHYIEDDTHLRVLIQQPEYCVYLSNWLSLSADHHWYSAATLRILNVVAQYSCMPLIDCINHVHQVAVRLSHEHPIPAVAMPAAKLIYPAILKTQDEQQDTLATTKPQTNNQGPLNSPQIKAKQKQILGNAQKEKPSQSNNPVDTPRLADKAKLTTALKQLTQQPEIFTDLHHLMHCCNDAIIDGLCLKRSLVLIANSEQSYMRVYYQKGVAKGNPLANYHIDLHQPGLIKKLMSKKSGFQITPANYNSICPILPEDFSTTVASQDLFLMSIFSGDRAVGMVMADAKGHVAPLTTGEYGTFKKLCQGVCHTLEDMSSRGGRKR